MTWKQPIKNRLTGELTTWESKSKRRRGKKLWEMNNKRIEKEEKNFCGPSARGWHSNAADNWLLPLTAATYEVDEKKGSVAIFLLLLFSVLSLLILLFSHLDFSLLWLLTFHQKNPWRVASLNSGSFSVAVSSSDKERSNFLNIIPLVIIHFVIICKRRNYIKHLSIIVPLCLICFHILPMLQSKQF